MALAYLESKGYPYRVLWHCYRTRSYNYGNLLKPQKMQF